MSAELVTTSLHDQMEFARTVVAVPKDEKGKPLGARSLLPESYRDNPANVLIAVGLGSAMGLSPAESLYRIDVIQGKPTAGAELIAANVRKAGHKLRVKVTEDPPSATCTIIRADDPDEPTTVTRDMDWAVRMGLASKANYKSQPATMLSWRAISACARLACPEALYGVAYTPDEMWDTDDRPARRTPDPVAPAPARMAAILGQEPDEPFVSTAFANDPVAPAESPLLDVTGPLAKRMFATLGDLGIKDKPDRLAYVSKVLEREVTSSTQMSDDDAECVILQAEHDLEQPFPIEVEG